ncbi:MAG: penicillin-binding protein [Erysipelotrichaceae bacterium]|nr:penicillin-binding protein [Erysipelotrichaceae bacterium]
MFIIAANVFIVAIVKVHFTSGTPLSAYADSANLHKEIIRSTRGNIYDKNGTVIAQDIKTYNIVCFISEERTGVGDSIAYVDDVEKTAQVLSEILKANYDDIYALLNQNEERRKTGQTLIYQTELGLAGRNITKETKEKIEAAGLNGIEFTSSVQRSYPLGVFASYLIGFAQSDENGSVVGKMGVEQYLNRELSGKDGERSYQADKNGYILPGMKEETIAAVNGNDVYLTLDQDIQETLEQCFLLTDEQFHADRVWGSVMEVDTGKILAWGQYPSFNPNTLDIDDYNNYGAQLPYEPGSTMKPFVYAAAVNEGKYDENYELDTTRFCFVSDENRNPVRVAYGGIGCITNASNKVWGVKNVDYGLIYSSNVIAATVMTEFIGPDIYLDYLKRFGFFQAVDTDGLREETGILNYTWPFDKVALSYGQGSTVTMLQMMQAYSAIFTDGTMKKPYFIEKIVDSYDSSNVIYQAETHITGNPITADTAAYIREILWHVVNDDDGTAKYYQIPETELIGKTGTTQVAVSGTYNSGKTIASIVVGMPADDPKYLVYYCFEAAYNRNAHYLSTPVTTLLRKVAMNYNLTNGINVEEEEQSEDAGYVKREVKTYKMENLVNHSLDYAAKKIPVDEVEIILLGDGDTVIDQYPKADMDYATGQKVFLLTDTGGFEMPDLTGWTRKEVAQLWELVQVDFKFDGFGKVVEQSLPPGTIVNKTDKIQVVLE